MFFVNTVYLKRVIILNVVILCVMDDMLIIPSYKEQSKCVESPQISFKHFLTNDCNCFSLLRFLL